jgi:hypothetical protein
VESTKILTQQSKFKSGDTKIQSAQYDQSKVRGWSCLPTANSLTRLGESLLLKEWDESATYDITGPCNFQWLVLRQRNTTEEATTLATTQHKYPKFNRVRSVHRDHVTGVLQCSCCYFQRIGISCQHILAVLRSVLGKNSFQGVTETSIRVFWWSKYSHYGVLNLGEHQSLLNSLLTTRLCDNDVHGPVLPSNSTMPANIDWHDNTSNPTIVATSRQPITSCCYNYSSEQCVSALQDRALVNDASSTLSQDYWNFNNDGDDSIILADHSINNQKARRTNVFEKLNILQRYPQYNAVLPLNKELPAFCCLLWSALSVDSNKTFID